MLWGSTVSTGRLRFINHTCVCFDFDKMGKKKFKQQEKTKVEYVIDNTVTNKVRAMKDTENLS